LKEKDTEGRTGIGWRFDLKYRDQHIEKIARTLETNNQKT